MAFYKSGRATAASKAACAMRSARSWRARISSIARNPETRPAATRTLTDLELASRLSFFLWSSLPDEELLKLATESRLQQTRRAGRTGEPHACRPAGRSH